MRALPLVLVALLLPASAFATDDASPQEMPTVKRVTGAELQREITGNTVSGRHATGMPFSEFHSPDGRIYGHNNHEPVRDGCWVVRGDEICYTYEKGTAPGVFCWQFFRASGGYTILLPRSGTIGSAKLEQGNPYNWNNGGDPWSCDALLSWTGPETPQGILRKYAALARGERYTRHPAASAPPR